MNDNFLNGNPNVKPDITTYNGVLLCMKNASSKIADAKKVLLNTMLDLSRANQSSDDKHDDPVRPGQGEKENNSLRTRAIVPPCTPSL